MILRSLVMNNNDKLFELMTIMYNEMHSEFKKIREELENAKKELKDNISSVRSKLKNFR